jgi:hypothetical protein
VTTVAAVLARQRQAVPHHQVRGFGPVEIGVVNCKAVSAPALAASRTSPAGRPCQQAMTSGAKQAGQRSVGSLNLAP